MQITCSSIITYIFNRLLAIFSKSLHPENNVLMKDDATQYMGVIVVIYVSAVFAHTVFATRAFIHLRAQQVTFATQRELESCKLTFIAHHGVL